MGSLCMNEGGCAHLARQKDSDDWLLNEPIKKQTLQKSVKRFLLFTIPVFHVSCLYTEHSALRD